MIGLGIRTNKINIGGGAAATPPSNSVAPAVSGTAVVGQVLTTTDGTWAGTAPITYSYQWKRGATNIGTNASTYTLVSADAGQSITCVVTATNAVGSANATSNSLNILSTVLDLYTSATAAYSLRLLRGAQYNSALVRIRRSSDNAEVDVFVDSNFALSLNSNIISRTSGTTLGTWVGSNNGFVVTWYDQSSNTRNATQSTPLNQPQLISSGVLNSINTKPALLFDGTNDSLTITTFSFTSNNFHSFVGKRSTAGHLLMSLAGSQYNLAHWTDNKYYFQGATNNTYLASNSADTNTNHSLIIGQSVSNTLSLFVNNNSIASTTLTTAINTNISSIGNYPSAFFTRGQLQEIIFYNTDQSSNRTSISNNINTFYGIY
jgi:hypothetical protein